MTLLVTGGAGFIGSRFVLDWLACHQESVVNLDALAYAGNPMNLAALDGDPRHRFVHGSVNDGALVAALLAEHRPRAVLHFAAESHVDRSLAGPGAFVATNVDGTFALLEAVRAYWQRLSGPAKPAFRYLQVSTDEVYGTLGPLDPAFTEATPFAPNSPYAASKAAADLLARAWHRSYGLPVLITHCSNNYGPHQFPEKLIPLTIERALEGAPLPVYGDGLQVRDWLYVDDHCEALRRVLAEGVPGRSYNIGGNAEHTNLDVVHRICALLDAQRPRADGVSYRAQIAFVADRPGHDRRYAIDASRMATELGWVPGTAFDDGLARTVAWYLSRRDWVDAVKDGRYRDWVASQYEARA
ncbi:dTDP-glucose 4,6-dehydratase [Crenobacter luteus]|uniref:dTDP-glucose 4,6-dehydratase n=1 Tax=Crenobacter luteus TaxID=1452487 RepID=A0A165FGQ6_9NEIS|nr:dTDP-glucose 4,6-dehydratase [Crenobacter luteus]KZE33215.1 dTDP-glucose 4,6-dehydratase [Crenobacter luteus]TCP08488.1 dTDP-glucose 4,6-dehydratase [Crenobacter luteus]